MPAVRAADRPYSAFEPRIPCRPSPRSREQYPLSRGGGYLHPESAVETIQGGDQTSPALTAIVHKRKPGTRLLDNQTPMRLSTSRAIRRAIHIPLENSQQMRDFNRQAPRGRATGDWCYPLI